MMTKYLLILISLFFSFQLFSQQDTVYLKAKNGDGIYSILNRNGFKPSEYANVFIELNQDKLLKNNYLIVGKEYMMIKNTATNSSTVVSATSSPKIKGKLSANDYQPKIIDQKLKGSCFYIISGHGGPDPGTTSKLNGKSISEDEFAYDICLRLVYMIREHGGTAYMIIRDPNDSIRNGQVLSLDRDEVCYPNSKIPLNQIARLKQRVDAVNALYVQNKKKYQHHRVLSVHIDSRYKANNVDVFFYYNSKSVKGKKLATTLKSTFVNQYKKHQPNRPYTGTSTERGLYVLRNTYPVAAFVELGNINNEKDRKRLIQYSNRQALAKWLYLGLLNDFENTKKKK